MNGSIQLGYLFLESYQWHNLVQVTFPDAIGCLAQKHLFARFIDDCCLGPEMRLAGVNTNFIADVDLLDCGVGIRIVRRFRQFLLNAGSEFVKLDSFFAIHFVLRCHMNTMRL